MVRVTGLRIRLEEDGADLRGRIAAHIGIEPGEVESVEVVRRALDARKKSGLYFVYTLNAELAGGLEKSPAILANSSVSPCEHTELPSPPALDRPPSPRPVVVGTGPAGLFAALALALSGAAPLVLERGGGLDKRVSEVDAFWGGKGLDPGSNVQFGEGGAGTFSDGKLTTRINDPRVRHVLKTLVDMGAPAEIMYEAKPHVGTDRLRGVLRRFRKLLAGLGAEIRFDAMVESVRIKDGALTGLIVNGETLDTGCVVLAPGNAARDTFGMLHSSGVSMEAKPFALGVRVEHPRELIDRIQYGRFAGDPRLGAADYMLTYNDSRAGRAAYTFCMCPGGRVVAAASEPDGVVVNGMSNYKRDDPCSNSALVVTVGPADYGSGDPLAGVVYQQRWERLAFRLGGGGHNAPAQDMESFLAGRMGGRLGLASYMPGVTPAPLEGCLPEFVTGVLRRAIPAFDHRMKGFMHPEAVLTGVETRTSSPVRILRGEDFQSPTVRGLYPCGEGSGYAGGIVSSAVDGIKAAEKLLVNLAAKS